MTEKPRMLTDDEIEALKRDMAESVAWAQAELCRRDHTPNALTAETMRKSDAGIDVFTVKGRVDQLMDELEVAEKGRPAI